MTASHHGDEAERLHRRLVDSLRSEGTIRDPQIEAAFRAVRRHWFLPGAPLDDVYRDRALVTHRSAEGVPISSSSQPALMALMLEQLDVRPGMAVLEIGTGTGYNAALLGHLAGPGGRVVTVDLDPEITGPAKRQLAAVGASNVAVVTADGWQLDVEGPFDRIVATVGVWDLSPAWVSSLAAGGRLVVPLWLRAGQQVSVTFRPAGAGLESVSVEPCGFMRMRGPGAGDASYRQIGPWTVSLDSDDPELLDVLATLLDAESSVRRVPPLGRGWFTPIALAEPGAVSLFSDGPGGPVIRSGLVQVAPPALAVVETHPPAADQLRVFGDPALLDRLVDVLRRRPAIDQSQLSISALPAGVAVDAVEPALATLRRPNFTFIVR
jgi:protein-L-isoaspartate(D-aspartate) O-methyltransferase